MDNESFVSFSAEKWTDWVDAVGYFEKEGSNACMAYDNLPIKAYVYPTEDIMKVHDLSHSIATIGGKASICPEDGYTLLDVIGIKGMIKPDQLKAPGYYQ